ncbi:FtsX-like permease family protein [Parabacteroides sp. PF5-6]|uniref:ABC transporter permease n=1 Tax=Parabacteroides sp. PF5-6 TaxID=1742403 RepID=UPI002406C2D9|nr:FtsX-like permease family protein [Parabacteroides sp. PF5-6]MDF9831052.1 putative ABC transport system permease protein [Parabacteroides sp. PF5-6]
MIKHILKQIWVERRQNSWILLELLVVFFFLLLMTDFLWVKLKNYMEPKGFDIEHTYMMRLKTLEPIAPNYLAPEENAMTKADEAAALVDRIRQYPDVEAISLSIFAEPYSMGGLWNGLRADTLHSPSMRCRVVTPSYFEVFRIRSFDGTPLRVEAAGNNQFVLTRTIAETLFDTATDALGKEVYNGTKEEEQEVPFRVIAVSEPLKRQDFYPYEPAFYEMLTPTRLNGWLATNDITWLNICVRIHPGRERHFEEMFEVEMGDRLQVNNLYVASVVPSHKFRDEVVGKMLREDVLLMTYVMVFVLITVFLGIFGTFWLRTRQRRGEIAIRMAAGANRSTVWKYMIVEGLLLIVLVILPATLVYINLLYSDILDTWRLPFTAGRVAIALCSSLIILVLMVIGGINWPARRAARLELAEALRDE